MRCSKCGYISFDHLDSCRKCHKPMVATELKGTTCSAVVPLFLDLSLGAKVDREEQDMVDILDPDLDLLADGEEVIDFGDNMVDNQNVAMNAESQASDRGEISPGDDFEIAFAVDSKETDLTLDEEDLLIDTSRFEDVPINIQTVQAAQPVQLKIPEGLADISDLARPSVAGGLSPATGGEVTGGLDVDLDFDDLRLDDLNLSLGGQKVSDSASITEEDDFAALSLDDIDLSGSLEVAQPQSSSPSEDDDLDFDLDLGMPDKVGGGLQKKSADDLPEFSLSLE